MIDALGLEGATLSGPKWLFLGGALVVSALVALALVRPDSPATDAPAAQLPSSNDQALPNAGASTVVSDSAPIQQPIESTRAVTDQPVVAGDDAFRVDANGKLFVDETTRLNLEAMTARGSSEQLLADVREQTEGLPDSAARAAEELVQKFAQYQQAQRSAYPPSEAPPTADDAIRELEGLHALREAHFGPELAKKLYGREEAIAREMIEVMRIENDPSLSIEEKQRRAQALRQQLPGIASIERRNRESVPPAPKSDD